VFNKFFGKKNDGFYMQVEDNAPAPKVEAKAKPSPAVTAAPPAADVAPTAVAEKAVAKAEKKSAKKAVDEKKVAPVAPAPVASAPVAPAPALPPLTNFATDYLIKPSSDSTRRRPGANMSKFLELAREAKIPVNIKK
jgi:hypothetical protein